MEVSRSDRFLAGAGLMLLLAPGLIFWERLPDPVATHWGFEGRPDDHLSKLVWMVGSVFFWALLWSVYLYVREKAPSTWKPPFTFGIVGGLAFAQASIVEANLDAPSWASADQLNSPLVMAAFFGAWLTFGLITYAVERR